ncbi:SRPBCC domain-containing protein [Nocardiopsis lambiniae]|uniref:SRPBCC domain-containing protein n=1 Tax=Nocardiopsis lambiniae TaxID=3075539 RepID=A0ABU2M5H5_9ACTN|nr:SRPBCC domain-containing protein [Nocardiopsis sp. DSM 44743]MDT0327877.1 SRPBCC domain-containing protein [Nocardiopsis sp. DSM 44743]
MIDDIDRIERAIDIDASVTRVWALITRPGWFINDGAIIDHAIERDGDIDIVRDPVHGDFRIRTEKLDPHRYAAFRWLDDDTDASTLVEFHLDELPAGGVRLRVVESGFATLGGTEAYRRRRFEQNAQGWEIELAAARDHLDPLAVRRAVHVDATPERLWETITEPARFVGWYAFDGADFVAEPGAPMELRWDEHGTFRGRVVEAVAPRRFAYRIAAETDTDPGDDSTLVVLEVRASGEGSLLTVTQTGFTDPEEAAAETDGWEGGFAGLAEHLAGARG